MTRLAILTTHPIQYHVPWFQYLAQDTTLDIKVFYLWDFGVTDQVDNEGFEQVIRWDLPLLSGYDFEFVQNSSRRPGTDHFLGLRNPHLLERVSEFCPDVVLVYGYRFASMMAFIWRWNRRAAPLLFRGDSHRLLRETGIKAWCRRVVIGSIYKRFSGFLYVGEANRDYFRMHGVSDSSLFFAPHAVDNARFTLSSDETGREALKWRRELGIPESDKIILFAGKFETKKRPLDLLEAFLRLGLPDVTLLFVGSGPLETELRARTGQTETVRFAPFQNQSLMPRTYAIGDVFVLPSYGPDETWGLAVNEAMCLSLPIIASDHVGCVMDLVHPYRNGLVFPAGDVDGLMVCLREALADASRLAAWGEESRRIIERYNYECLTNGLLLALDRLGLPSERMRKERGLTE